MVFMARVERRSWIDSVFANKFRLRQLCIGYCRVQKSKIRDVWLHCFRRTTTFWSIDQFTKNEFDRLLLVVYSNRKERLPWQFQFHRSLLSSAKNRDEKSTSGAVSPTKEFIQHRKLVAYKNVIELNDARRDRSEIFRSVEDVSSDVRVRVCKRVYTLTRFRNMPFPAVRDVCASNREVQISAITTTNNTAITTATTTSTTSTTFTTTTYIYILPLLPWL